MLFILVAAAALSVVPVHGIVIDALSTHEAIVRTDAIPMTLPPVIRRYALRPGIRLEPGVGIDAYLDRSTTPWTLRKPAPAPPFAPGLPDRGRVVPVDVNAALPAAELVDQDGRMVRLNRAFAGKTLLLSFVFTRCPDRTLCPAISGKFAYMQQRLDPSRFALAEVTLDPPYDSPAVLRAYGDQYGAHSQIWTLMTGKGAIVQRLLDTFGIESMRVSTSNFIHNDRLYIVSPQGRIADVIQTAGWDPEAAIAQARAVAGLSSNPFERWRLSLIGGVVALCGGSQTAGIVLLETVLFFAITAVVVSSLWAVGRVLWPKTR
ncbi:MAG TPA: SCO family protein [Candidatus Baltobacteraceae bacterium]|nr:SCO family protein [Candidatus Baltobacteraceae bacterium]